MDVRYVLTDSVLITDSMIELDDSIDRPGQPCWCPDAFLEACFYVRYCPMHGSHPDPDLWDHSVEPFPAG
jgi:hypothetical protein